MSFLFAILILEKLLSVTDLLFHFFYPITGWQLYKVSKKNSKKNKDTDNTNVYEKR